MNMKRISFSGAGGLGLLRARFTKLGIVLGMVGSCFLCGTAMCASERRFDFGPANEPPNDGWIRVDHQRLFDGDYGWEKRWGGCFQYDRASPFVMKEDPVASSGITANTEHERAATFRVAVANGVYQVIPWLGDPSPREGRQGICVAINGKLVLPPPGIGGWGKVNHPSLPAVVSNGELEVAYLVVGRKAADRLSVLGLEIIPVERDQAESLRREWQSAPLLDSALKDFE